jgi:hypothetical protein
MNEQVLDLIDDIVWYFEDPERRDISRDKVKELRLRIDSLRDQERDEYYREI